MSVAITLAFANAVGPAELRDLIRALGGEADPDMGADARLSRGSDHVWVYGPDTDDERFDPDEDTEYERLLGGPIEAEVRLHLSRSPGSPRLALEIVEAAAARGWRFVVDNEYGPLTLDAVRDLAVRSSSVFWEWPWE